MVSNRNNILNYLVCWLIVLSYICILLLNGKDDKREGRENRRNLWEQFSGLQVFLWCPLCTITIAEHLPWTLGTAALRSHYLPRPQLLHLEKEERA